MDRFSTQHVATKVFQKYHYWNYKYFSRIMDVYSLFRSKAFKKGDKLSDSQGFILMAFVNDVVGDSVHNVQNIVQEGVGADKEHMSVDKLK